MKKRIFKQGMALMLAAALALPANVVPAEILDQQTETELPHIVLNQETPDEKATDSDAKEKEEQTETQTETKTEVNATETAEQIIYNTGSFNVHVVSEEDFENDLGDAYFEAAIPSISRRKTHSSRMRFSLPMTERQKTSGS